MTQKKRSAAGRPDDALIRERKENLANLDLAVEQPAGLRRGRRADLHALIRKIEFRTFRDGTCIDRAADLAGMLRWGTSKFAEVRKIAQGLGWIEVTRRISRGGQQSNSYRIRWEKIAACARKDAADEPPRRNAEPGPRNPEGGLRNAEPGLRNPEGHNNEDPHLDPHFKPQEASASAEVSAEPQPKAAASSAMAGEPTEFVFETVGKGPRSWTLPRPKLDEYAECYPSLDVRAEIRRARQWIRDNPSRRKTAGGMLAFLTRWLNRTQDRGGSNGPRTAARRGPTNGPGQRYDPGSETVHEL